MIDRGHIFIAQPPLFRVKRGRSEVYIKDERQLENYLIRRAAESRLVKLADGSELVGEALEQHLQRMIAYRRLLLQVDASPPSPRRRVDATGAAGARHVVLRAARVPGYDRDSADHPPRAQ